MALEMGSAATAWEVQATVLVALEVPAAQQQSLFLLLQVVPAPGLATVSVAQDSVLATASEVLGTAAMAMAWAMVLGAQVPAMIAAALAALAVSAPGLALDQEMASAVLMATEISLDQAQATALVAAGSAAPEMASEVLVELAAPFKLSPFLVPQAVSIQVWVAQEDLVQDLAMASETVSAAMG